MKDWDNVYKRKGEVQTEVMEVVTELAKLLGHDKKNRILDLGCGTGRHTVFLAKKGFDVFGIDKSITGLGITRNKLNDLGLDAHIEKMDMHSLNFQEEYFDAVISTFVINHGTTGQIKKIISDIYRILKPGGYFTLVILSDNDGWYAKGKKIEEGTYIPVDSPDEGDVPHHYFSEAELRNELKNLYLLTHGKRHHLAMFCEM